MIGRLSVGYVAFLACTAALGGRLFGFDIVIVIITGAGPFLTQRSALSDFSLGIAFSSYSLGAPSVLSRRQTHREGLDVQYPWKETRRRHHLHEIQTDAIWIDKYPVTDEAISS